MSYPTDPPFNSATFSSQWANLESESTAFVRKSRWLGGQRFAFTGRYTNMSRAMFRGIWSFCQAQRGANIPFKLQFPVLSDTDGDATGTCRINNLGGYPIGAEVLEVFGHSRVITNGSFITIASHSKAYILTADRDGAGPMSISPPLLKPVADSDVVTYTGVEFTVTLPDTLRFTFPQYDNFNYSLDFVEDI